MPPKRKRGRPRKAKGPNCIRCLANLEKPYQLIFDETGIELELQKLLSECFKLDVVHIESEEQALCDTCLNELIDIYDLLQKVKVEKEDEPNQIYSSKVEPLPTVADVKSEEESDDNITETEITLNAKEADKLNNVEFSEEQCDKDEYRPENNPQTEELERDSDDEGDPGVYDNEPEEFEDVDYLEDNDEIKDFKAYKKKVIRSNCQDITFPTIECCICSAGLNTHLNVIEHIKTSHCVEDFAYPCIVDSKCEPLKSCDDLAYHLVFQHYDLKNLTIYCCCPECKMNFSDFPSYNKHNCSRKRETSRIQTECENCGKKFNSNKRYRFHMQFHLEKHRPKACFICDKNISKEKDLYEHLMYGHEKDLDTICILCDKKFGTIENYKNHESLHKIRRPYKCKFCGKTYLYKQLLQAHILIHHSNGNPFKCHICGKVLIKKTFLNKHILSHQQPNPEEVSCCNVCGLVSENNASTSTHLKEHKGITDANIIIETLEIAYCCEYCEMAFNSIENLVAHRDTHEDKTIFYCDLCPLTYNEYKKLVTHKLTHINHADRRSKFPLMRHYVCDKPGCDLSYLQWSSLKSHKRHKHRIDDFFCPRCSEHFQDEDSYKIHIRDDHSEGVYDCQFCDKIFKTKMAVAVHVARIHHKSRFKCSECTLNFQTEKCLQEHKETAHAHFACDICGKILKNKKNYNVHKRMVHDKELRFFCTYCEKGFFNKCDLTDHEHAVHEKIKRYQCKLCDYSAVYKDSLTIHMRAHENDNPYVCQLCGKSFRRKYGLVLHDRRHRNIRDFICPYGCGSSYPNQGILNSHIRSKHQNGGNKRRKRISLNKLKRPRFDALPSYHFTDDDDGLNDDDIELTKNNVEDSPNELNDESHKFQIKQGNEDDPEEQYMPADADLFMEDGDGLNNENEMEIQINNYSENDPDGPVEYIIEEIPNLIEDTNQIVAATLEENQFDHDYILKIKPEKDQFEHQLNSEMQQ